MGAADGSVVGLADGDAEGDVLGIAVGDADGSVVGIADGDADGCLLCGDSDFMIRNDQNRRIFPLFIAYHACRSFVRNRGGVVARMQTGSKQKEN